MWRFNDQKYDGKFKQSPKTLNQIKKEKRNAMSSTQQGFSSFIKSTDKMPALNSKNGHPFTQSLSVNR